MALPSGEITGLVCDHCFWNMQLRALHVLARGEATSDVVVDMWKLSKVWAALPQELRELNGRLKTCIQANKCVFVCVKKKQPRVCMLVCFGCVRVHCYMCTVIDKISLH